VRLSIKERQARAEALGRATEARVRAAFDLEPWPWWFCGVRHGSVHEDRKRGIDFVIYTRHVGRIMVQAKSSIYHARKFEAHRGKRHRIHTIVARPNTDLHVVRGRLLWICIKAIEEAEAAGLRADDVELERIAA
jgi:hypothetical protein